MARSTVGRVLTTRTCASSWASRHRNVHTSENRGQDVTKGNVKEDASLPLLQRCKNLLAANWRGQLSTLKPDDDTVQGSLVEYALVGGQAIFWLPVNSPHASNLLIDSRGSLVVGHTDPRPLIRTLRAVGHVPPRTVVMGILDPIPKSECTVFWVDVEQTEYIKKRVLKLVSATKQAVEKAGARTQSILTDSGSSVGARINALDSMLHSTDEFGIYSLNPRACQYVDLLGGKHQVEVAEVAAATVDPLCPVVAGLIEGINQNETRRLALIMFCAVYMHVRVQDAYIFAADRWGINLLAKIERNQDGVASEGRLSSQPETEMEWREFRFAFSQEVQSTEQFCVLLAEMEMECLELLGKTEPQSG